MTRSEIISIHSPHEDGSMRVGVISDTHVPDRVKSLERCLLPMLQEHKVDLILHAGDICVPAVISQLEEVAPVLAVRGNRDILFKPRLPMQRVLDLAGVRVVLMHGHGGLIPYIFSKIDYLRSGYRLDFFRPHFKNLARGTRAVIFGHSHIPENFTEDGLLIFNPGSASLHLRRVKSPSFGILDIDKGEVKGEIVYLETTKAHTGGVLLRGAH